MPSPLHIESDTPGFQAAAKKMAERWYKNYAINRRFRFRSERSSDVFERMMKKNVIMFAATLRPYMMHHIVTSLRRH